MLTKVFKILKTLINPEIFWKGNYDNWDKALKDSIGYENDLILDKVVKANRVIAENKNWFERDGTIIKEPIINPNFLCSLYYIFINRNTPLKLTVLDFGGGLGSLFKQHRNYIPKKEQFNWNIIEQSNFVTEGKKEFETGELHFFHSIKEFSLENKSTDLLVLSSVLQYLSDPYKILDELLKLNPEYIIIDLTVFSPRLNSDVITVQNINEKYYGKKISYPCRLFSENNIVTPILKDYKEVFRGQSYIGQIKYERSKYNYNFIFLKKITNG